jgi:hypothetical protein
MKAETVNSVLVFRASKGFLLLIEPIHLTEKLTIFGGSLSKKSTLCSPFFCYVPLGRSRVEWTGEQTDVWMLYTWLTTEHYHLE